MAREVHGVGLFQCTGALPADVTDSPAHFSDDYGEQKAYEDAYVPAVALIAACRAKGAACDGPLEGDLGWWFSMVVGEHTVEWFLNWVPLGSEADAYFALHGRVQSRWHDLLFWRPRASSPVQVAWDILEKALRSVEHVAVIEWLSDDAFEERLGTPTAKASDGRSGVARAAPQQVAPDGASRRRSP